LVLDEDPMEGLPQAIAGSFESDSERVQRAAHMARVGIWDLDQDKLLARVHAEASGELRSAGTKKAEGGPASEAARARQANSCSLALQFKPRVLPTADGP